MSSMYVQVLRRSWLQRRILNLADLQMSQVREADDLVFFPDFKLDEVA